MRFTKEVCSRAIYFEPGDEPIYYTGEVFNTYPCVFNCLSFQLLMTPILTHLAEEICFPDGEMEGALFNFYISINDYNRIDNCIEGVTYGLDEEQEFQIPLDDEERMNIYERLNELCMKEYHMGCEEMLHS